MVILTAEQMKRIDQRTESEYGIPADRLMDNAGREVGLSLIRRFPNLASLRVLILCGKGNNGGDGITAARHLLERHISCRVALLCRGAELKGAARTALDRARESGVKVEEIAGEAPWRELRRALPEHDIVVDALLGTGARAAPKGLVREAIEAINAAGCTVVSVDLPSGLSGSDAGVPDLCIEADVTITLAALKIPLVFSPASRFAGEVEIAEIGIPAAVVEAEGANLHWVDRAMAASILPRRDPASHKGDFGHVLVVAGSRGRSGAAVLLARACLRSGAGLVTVASPASAQPIIAACVPEAMTEPLPETGSGSLARSALPIVSQLLAARDVLAIGPGLGTADDTAVVVRGLIEAATKPMVVDADALNILALKPADRPEFVSPAILTPHPGEAGRVLGIASAEVQNDRPAAARRIARDLGCCAVLKGHRTLIASPFGTIHVNSTGNPGMATGGSGDALTGIAAAWLAQGLAAFDAATLSVFVHGLAGDLAARRLGEISVTAGDIVEDLPSSYRSLLPGRAAER